MHDCYILGQHSEMVFINTFYFINNERNLKHLRNIVLNHTLSYYATIEIYIYNTYAKINIILF
jgi:hypothetical protein